MKTWSLLAWFMSLLVVVTIAHYVEMDRQKQFLEADYLKRLKSYRICDGLPEGTDFGIDGIYFSDENYYCVDPVNTPERLNEIEIHEFWHYLTDDERREHFCECGGGSGR